ncbi:uncharacterized protein LOC141724271 [Apium graveolens]|uniref:uncharacterized protein LOC141724271 n=1 Tax=Apium graveolens TaxID=4045 RepID=UPI003D79E81F
MPSPPIPCPISTPERSRKCLSLNSPDFIFLEQLSPQSSITSAKGTTWSKEFLKGRKSSELTEASLVEINRRNAVVEKNSASSSPYYKGLTDFTLDINKEKLPALGIHHAASPFGTSAENTTWSKKGKILVRKKKSEESFEEFSRRSLVSEERRYSTSSSPYYKGLTDFTLDIKKEKFQVLGTQEEPPALSKTNPLLEAETTGCKNEKKALNEDAVVVEKRHKATTPRYEGLTDFSSDINKEKMPATEFYEANCSEKSIFLTDQPLQSSTITECITGSKKIVTPCPDMQFLELHKESIIEYIQGNTVLQDKNHTVSSPYYKGLTDFTLDINKEKSPTIEIHEATSASTKPDRPPSDQSSELSATSKVSSWSKKATRFLTRKKGSSGLTEEGLEEFNRRNAILEEKRYSTSSPYYRGLTDFSLDINKEKVPVIEIHERASVTSSNRSSFVVRMQQLGTFCFFFKNKEKKDILSSSSSSQSRTWKDIDLGKEVKSSSTKRNTTHYSSNVGKPVRERELQKDHAPPQLLPTSRLQPPRTPRVVEAAKTSESKKTNVMEQSDTEEKEKPLQISQLEQISESEKSYPTQQNDTEETSTLATTSETIMSDATEQSDTDEKRKSFTWADNYRPYTLTDFLCNRETALELKSAANSEQCCHYIFEGKPGVGKRTMIWALLREAFGADKVQSRKECKEFGLKGEAVKSIQVNVKQSSQHVEVNLSELKGYEKHVIVELMKEKSTRLSDNVLPCTIANCRAIILYEADKLSADALIYIRWLLERYRGCNKVFFCCNDISKLHPIKHLCRVVKLLPPSTQEIMEVLKFVAKQEGIELSDKLAEKFADNSKNNLRQALRSFEATWRSNPELLEDQEIMTGWEDAIAKVASDILKEQSPQQLYAIRGKLQSLVEHNVSPTFIFQTLIGELKRHLEESLQMQIDKLYKDYNGDDYGNHRFGFPPNETKGLADKHNDFRRTVQQFMKIEEFIAKFMSWYKNLDVKLKPWT